MEETEKLKLENEVLENEVLENEAKELSNADLWKQKTEIKPFRSFATQEEFNNYMKTTTGKKIEEALKVRFKNKPEVGKPLIVDNLKDTRYDKIMESLSEMKETQKVNNEIVKKNQLINKFKKNEIKDEAMQKATILYNGLIGIGESESNALDSVVSIFRTITKHSFGQGSGLKPAKKLDEDEKMIALFLKDNPDVNPNDLK